MARPRNIEKEATVITGGDQLSMWQLPSSISSRGKARLELLSADDLLTKRGYKVYREMLTDDQVKACLWLKKMLVVGRSFDIVAEDEGNKDQAEFVEKALARVNFKRILWEMLTAYDFGVSFGEIIWHVDRENGSGEGELKVFLKDVAFRDPKYMHIEVDQGGNIVQFVQKPENIVGAMEIVVTPDRMLHYAYQSQFRNHWGISDLRGAYRAWWSKKYVTQFYNVFLERYGGPTLLMKYPQGASTELKDALKQIMSGLSSKSEILIPEGVNAEYLEATRAGTAKYEEALILYDNSIATGILMPALLGMGTDIKRGSDSQSRLHLGTLMKMIKFLCEEVEYIITEKIVQPMVEMNFPKAGRLRLKFQDYGEFESFEISNAIKELHNAGILTLDGEDTNYLRSILGMAVRGEDELDEVERPPVEQLPMAPGGNGQANGGGAGQGNKRAEKGASVRKTDKRTGSSK